MRAWVLVLVIGAAGCGGGPLQPPIVDQTGVDPAQYNRDLAACYEAAPAVSFGNPVTRCMEAKGYKVLVGF